MSAWTEWEQPWTRATGRLSEYEPMTEPPTPGMTVAVRSRAKPYLPTFAPWWAGLVVASVERDEVRFQNAPRFTASLTDYPLATHWAAASASPQGSTDG